VTEQTGPLPGRDPLADDDDLLTMGEAGARLTEELDSERARLAALETDPGTDDTALTALRRRVELLEDAAVRMMRGRQG
jgi:hypothetical protein